MYYDSWDSIDYMSLDSVRIINESEVRITYIIANVAPIDELSETTEIVVVFLDVALIKSENKWKVTFIGLQG